MVASGKSSNRFGEWRRGRNGTSRSGPYAARGYRERQAELERKRKEKS